MLYVITLPTLTHSSSAQLGQRRTMGTKTNFISIKVSVHDISRHPSIIQYNSLILCSSQNVFSLVLYPNNINVYDLSRKLSTLNLNFSFYFM